MKRRLRIAVSVFFALVAVAFAVLWARSYRTMDDIGLGVSARVQSFYGRLEVAPFGNKGFFLSPDNEWFWRTMPAAEIAEPTRDEMGYQDSRQLAKKYLFDFRFDSIHQIAFPHWFPLIVFACVAIVPWTAMRFSLRTLLIATTLIAVVLGLGVWAAS